MCTRRASPSVSPRGGEVPWCAAEAGSGRFFSRGAGVAREGALDELSAAPLLCVRSKASMPSRGRRRRRGRPVCLVAVLLLLALCAGSIHQSKASPRAGRARCDRALAPGLGSRAPLSLLLLFARRGPVVVAVGVVPLRLLLLLAGAVLALAALSPPAAHACADQGSAGRVAAQPLLGVPPRNGAESWGRD